jgi:hypothetical protein
MAESNVLVVVAGLVAYGVALVLGAGPLVYATNWFNQALTRKTDEDEQLRAGSRSIAIELGTTILCQAILIRHAVYAGMAMIRSLFVDGLSRGEASGVAGRSLLSILAVIGLALCSVQVSGAIFQWMIRKHVNVAQEIREKDNVAVALFYALVLLSIALVLDQGMQDFSRSLIPFGRAGMDGLP